jgi:2,3-bisphosphoglycerate-independent phosphoglycerate mutase
MKKVILVMDGASDLPLDELGGETPMQAAKTPHLDALAERGRVGKTSPAPEDMELGSDVANMSILGYDPRQYYTGRAPLEAASMGIPVEGNDVAFRLNLVATDGETMVDHSAGGLTTEEGAELVRFIQSKVFHTNDTRRLYPGVGYRHLMVWADGPADLRCIPPHNIVGQHFVRYMPEGDKDQSIRRKIWDSVEVLEDHPVNVRRRAEGKLAANMIWPWGPGRMPTLPDFHALRGTGGAMIAAVDLLKGLGKLAGLHTPDVPGATGYVETNWRGKADAALAALAEDRDFAFIHVEGPDEAGHQGDIEGKVYSIEKIDEELVGPLLEGLAGMGGHRLLVLPDHSTPVKMRKHESYNVPFLFYDSGNPETNGLPFDERGMRQTRFKVREGHTLIDLLFA